MSEACMDAINAASRSAPGWARVVWSQPLGLFAADPRYEDNTLKGFIEGLASLLARVCNAILYRKNILAGLGAVILEPWEVMETGVEECVARRRIRLVLVNGAGIVVNVKLYATPAGSFKRLEVESEELGCRGSWGH